MGGDMSCMTNKKKTEHSSRKSTEQSPKKDNQIVTTQYNLTRPTTETLQKMQRAELPANLPMDSMVPEPRHK